MVKNNSKKNEGDKFEDACEKFAEVLASLEDEENLDVAKPYFDDLVKALKEDGGLYQFYMGDIVSFNDLIDMDKAKKVLSSEMYKLVESLTDQLMHNDYCFKSENALLCNYLAYKSACTNVALCYAMLTGTTTFINHEYLQGLKKLYRDDELKYLEGAKNLVKDEMVFSHQWRILFRHYKKDFYNFWCEEGEGNAEDIALADHFDWENALFEMAEEDLDDLDFEENEEERAKKDYEFFTKYGIKTYYPLPKR